MEMEELLNDFETLFDIYLFCFSYFFFFCTVISVLHHRRRSTYQIEWKQKKEI